jgi:hypothetical protein
MRHRFILFLAFLAACSSPSRDEASMRAAAVPTGHKLGIVSVFLPKVDTKQQQNALFDQAKEFYTDVLEFDGPVVDFPLETIGTFGRWIQLSMHAQPDLSIVLKAGRLVTDNAILTIIPPSTHELCAFYHRLVAKGVKVTEPPTDQPWAVEMTVLDPFGQWIVVGVPKVPFGNGPGGTPFQCDGA